MKEGLSHRVGRIIAGTAHAIVDAVESAAPELVMEQAIREIDGAVDEVRAELGRTVAAKHVANKRLMAENHRHEDLADKIKTALDSDREDLAEAAIAKQLDIEAQIPVLESTIADCTEAESELEGYIQALQAKKRDMQEELRQFREARKSTMGAEAAAAQGDTGRTSVEERVERAEGAFDRVLSNTTGVPPGNRGDMMNAAKLAELDDLARRNRIAERLAAAKAAADSSTDSKKKGGK